MWIWAGSLLTHMLDCKTVAKRGTNSDLHDLDSKTPSLPTFIPRLDRQRIVTPPCPRPSIQHALIQRQQFTRWPAGYLLASDAWK